jgi:NAD(P)-dependent dehydrogenase (short-subunit alcohol dehydrogenase family)
VVDQPSVERAALARPARDVRDASGMAQRVAVVTGAGTGIGRAAAVALAVDGWATVAAGRRLEPLEETCAAVVEVGGQAIAVTADVADPASVDALFAQVDDTYGRVDLLFNNAGTGSYPVPFEEVPFDDWQRVVNVNLTGSFLCAQRAVARMKQQDPTGGRIINNGSISAHTPRPNSAPYTATKHAITGLTKSLSLDGRPFGITCGQIDIGNAATPMTSHMADGVAQADGSIRAEPTMDVADVGRAVAYMASLPPDANVLTMTVMANEMPFVGRG